MAAADIAMQLEVSSKTVQRDLEFMRDRLHIPIVSGKEGRYLVEKVALCASCNRHDLTPYARPPLILTSWTRTWLYCDVGSDEGALTIPTIFSGRSPCTLESVVVSRL